MLDAANEALSSSQAKTRKDLEQDHIWTLGLIKCIEIIGEAAAQISAETRAAAPTVPWQEIIGMRNRLVHVYFDIDFDQVWSTVQDDLPALITLLKKLIPDDPQHGE